MAKQEYGYLGTFRGSMGTAIGYQWRGRWCMRARPTQVRNPRTPEQVAHRQLFKRMVQFAGRQRVATRIGLKDSSLEMGMTECNRFVQLNNDAFGWDSGAMVIDYSALRFAEGVLAQVAFAEPTVSDKMVVSIDFEKNPSHATRADAHDLVMIYALCPEVGDLGVLALPVHRRSRKVSMALPDEWSGRDVYLYGWVQNWEGAVSDSQYIGCVNSTDCEQDNDVCPEDSTAVDASPQVINQPIPIVQYMAEEPDATPPSAQLSMDFT